MTLYRTIVADPPWPITFGSGGAMRRKGNGVWYRNAAGGLPYETLTVDAIAALPIERMAAADAHLFLWVPDSLLIDGSAVRVARAWGFEPLRTLIWHKPNFGLGAFPRPQHEPLLIARRGAARFSEAVRDVGSVQAWPVRYFKSGGSVGKDHSSKPDAALDLVERASEGPYLELFARRARFGWDYWGDQSLGTAVMPKAETQRAPSPGPDDPSVGPANRPRRRPNPKASVAPVEDAA